MRFILTIVTAYTVFMTFLAFAAGAPEAPTSYQGFNEFLATLGSTYHTFAGNWLPNLVMQVTGMEFKPEHIWTGACAFILLMLFIGVLSSRVMNAAKKRGINSPARAGQSGQYESI